MQLAKLTDKGQITLSPETRRKLGVRGGDKVLLVEQADGFFITNANKLALKSLQAGLQGIANELGIKTEDDITALVHEVRGFK
ncbi:MAG: AbrB/MazE/SpoVT family DNA-binding domain-containing protein [Firmicutes bacterium]|nr:AbrB/MazE/SpoVT family DNA-binding domain-containing protein [Bacillota bacterium]